MFRRADGFWLHRPVSVAGAPGPGRVFTFVAALFFGICDVTSARDRVLRVELSKILLLVFANLAFG